MNIGFFDPYFDGFGGGERYVLTLASHWSNSHAVSLFWNDPGILKNSEKRFGIDLSRVRVVKNIFREKNTLKKLYTTRTFDVIFFVTDGSIPTSLAHHNILHIQVPFSHVRIPLWKSWLFDAIICNSEFTKSHIHSIIQKRAQVIYPPVDIDRFSSNKKIHSILTVGRFNSLY
jgi:hypothetical protein